MFEYAKDMPLPIKMLRFLLIKNIWKRWSGWHRQSLVKTRTNYIKRLAKSEISKTFECQMNKLRTMASY